VNDGQRLVLGDTTLTLYVTPGHTIGTISPLFEVRAGGRSYRALLWGGTAFNFGKDIPRLDSYIAATERMRGLAAQLPIDLLLSNHPGYDGTVAKLDALRSRPGATPNPFVMGPEAVARALGVMGECARATRDRYRL
jgi:metallo-beta-lactamase class B